MKNLSEEKIKELTQNTALVEAIRLQKTKEKEEKQQNTSVEKLKRIIQRNPNIIALDLNRAGLKQSQKLRSYCNEQGYKIRYNLIEINPEPEKQINPIKKLTEEQINLIEKRKSHQRILESIDTRINKINAELIIIKSKKKNKPKVN